MTAAVAEPQADNTKAGTLVVKYNVSDEHIAKLRSQLSGLTAETPAKYEMVRKGIQTCRELRTGIENTRKALKADSLEYGRRVDAEAKRITAAIEAIENPLKAAKQSIDDEAARVQREKEQAEQRAREEQARLAREEEEARIRAERAIEEARLKAEQAKLAEERRLFEAQRAEQEAKDRVERERLAAERAEQEARDRAEREKIEAQQRAEREALAAQRAEFEAQQRAAREEEDRRQAAARAEQEEKDRIERERIEAEQAAERARIAEEQRVQHEAELAARREAMRQDLEKVRTWATAVTSAPVPVLASAELTEQLRRAGVDIARRLDVLIEQITEGP